MRKNESLKKIESQLLRLDHEIFMLSFRAEEAMPNVMAECYRYIQTLRQQYQTIDTRLQKLRKARGSAWKEQSNAMDDALRELDCLIESIGMQVRIRLAAGFGSRYPG